MIVPVYSAGVMIVSFSIGSSMWSMNWGSGMSEGLSTGKLSPFVRWAMYSTEGAVAISESPNSRSRRSRTMSMCNRPKNPQRKPKPSAALVSGS